MKITDNQTTREELKMNANKIDKEYMIKHPITDENGYVTLQELTPREYLTCIAAEKENKNRRKRKINIFYFG
jgi:hypothetical protein